MWLVIGSVCPGRRIIPGEGEAAHAHVEQLFDNAEIVAAFNSGEGETVLLNIIGSKRTSFRAALGV